MKVPLLPLGAPINMTNGEWSDDWINYFQQLQLLMQQAVSDEGFVIPSQEDSDVSILASSQKIPAGSLVFNTDVINGGSPDFPNGQLYVKLQNGSFRPVTNT